MSPDCSGQPRRTEGTRLTRKNSQEDQNNINRRAGLRTQRPKQLARINARCFTSLFVGVERVVLSGFVPERFQRPGHLSAVRVGGQTMSEQNLRQKLVAAFKNRAVSYYPIVPIWVELGADPSSKHRDYNTLPPPPRDLRIGIFFIILPCSPSFRVRFPVRAGQVRRPTGHSHGSFWTRLPTVNSHQVCRNWLDSPESGCR